MNNCIKGIKNRLSYTLKSLCIEQSIAQWVIFKLMPGDFVLLLVHKRLLAAWRDSKVPKKKNNYLNQAGARDIKGKSLLITGFEIPKCPEGVWLYHYIINHFLTKRMSFRCFGFAIDCGDKFRVIGRGA